MRVGRALAGVAVAGMAIAHGKRGCKVRWLTSRRIDAWLHYRNES